MKKELIANVDIKATRHNMRLLNVTRWCREKNKLHPGNPEICPQVVSMMFSDPCTYPHGRPLAQLVLRYMKEDGYLVLKDDGDQQAA